ncbi:hypothetical protein EXV95_05900 [Acidovorax sp. JMULE5]|uniref:hypothetical protein n=1 Tax=Acidovorax sp. JMULE5 TaxID=2518343 RepID=UPI0015A39525|nr:hypothetical protein [Acidovorax sp. JMULE5]QLA80213.1 hypothetical protein EXV95_05900 [Acidovorax sp. JMULE5]
MNHSIAKAIVTGISALGMATLGHAESFTVQLDGPMDPLYGIQNNSLHGKLTTCGYKLQSENHPGCTGNVWYGAWFDGPINPYKYNGNTYFQVPHSQNFRFNLPNHNWGDRLTWIIEPASFTAGYPEGALLSPPVKDTVESHYNMAHWIYSPYVVGSTIYGLTHHEWYPNTMPFGGKIVANSVPVWGIGWISSTNGGASWAMKPINYGAPSNADRLVIVPEPHSSTYTQEYGFAHPSNIVKEGIYYYAFVTSLSNKPGGVQERGVSIIRTSNLASATGWQFWNGSSWTTVNHGTYQGGSSTQQPYIFWKETANACTTLLAHNVRKHSPSGKWIVLGSASCFSNPYRATFTWIDNLSNPSLLDKTTAGQPRYPEFINQNGHSMPANKYVSFFNVDATVNSGDNYETIGNKPLLVGVDQSLEFISHQFLTITYTP